MKPTTGFLNSRLMKSAASSSAVPTDFADHDDGVGVGIRREETQCVDVARANQRIAADADAGRLPHPLPGELMNGFVGERAALGDDPDAAFLADVTRNNSSLRLACGNDAGAVRPNETRGLALHEGHRPQHVDGGDPLCNAHRKGDTRIDGLHHRVGGKRGRHEDDGGIRTGLAHGVVHAVEDRPPLVGRATFAWRDAADDGRAVRRGLLGMERSLTTGEPLNDEPGVLVE